MSYGVVFTVAAPIEVYDVLHAELDRFPADGLVLHFGQPVDGGFKVTEIWESKEHLDRYNAEVLGPAIGRLAAGRPLPPPAVETFDVRGIRIPAATTG